MFTKEQEEYLRDLADKGLAEQAEIAARNVQVEAEAVLMAARAEKLADLQEQAAALIDEDQKEFDAKAGLSLTRG